LEYYSKISNNSNFLYNVIKKFKKLYTLSNWILEREKNILKYIEVLNFSLFDRYHSSTLLRSSWILQWFFFTYQGQVRKRENLLYIFWYLKILNSLRRCFLINNKDFNSLLNPEDNKFTFRNFWNKNFNSIMNDWIKMLNNNWIT
jgi:hypothetical protein